MRPIRQSNGAPRVVGHHAQRSRRQRKREHEHGAGTCLPGQSSASPSGYRSPRADTVRYSFLHTTSRRTFGVKRDLYEQLPVWARKSQVRTRAGSPIEAELAVDQVWAGLLTHASTDSSGGGAASTLGFEPPSQSSSLQWLCGSVLGVHSCGTVADSHRLPLARRRKLYPAPQGKSMGNPGWMHRDPTSAASNLSAFRKDSRIALHRFWLER